MEIETQKIDPQKVIFDSMNPQVMSDEDFQIIVDTVKKDGDLITCPTVRVEDGEVYCVDGEHRIRAALEAGLSEIDAKVLKGIDKQNARVRMLALNNLNGNPDETALSRMLLDMENNNIDITDIADGTGFDIEFLDHVIGMAEIMADPVETPTVDISDEPTVTSEPEETNLINELPPEKEVGMDETGAAPNSMQEDDMDSWVDFNISVSSAQAGVIHLAFAKVISGFKERIKNGVGVALEVLCSEYVDNHPEDGAEELVFARKVSPEVYERLTGYLEQARDTENTNDDGQLLVDLIDQVTE